MFDEIEKADNELFNLLLQILEDGILTDSNGRRCDFKNSIIIMTSNIGANLITNSDKIVGFGDFSDKSKNDERIKKLVLEEAKKIFKPEFLNRVDEMLVFKTLTKDEVNLLTRKMLNEFFVRCKEAGVLIAATEKLINHIAETGFDTHYGARPLRRNITNLVENPVTEKFLTGEIKTGEEYTIDFDEEKLSMSKSVDCLVSQIHVNFYVCG